MCGNNRLGNDKASGYWRQSELMVRQYSRCRTSSKRALPVLTVHQGLDSPSVLAASIQMFGRLVINQDAPIEQAHYWPIPSQSWDVVGD